jgi:hypothetical protein
MKNYLLIICLIFLISCSNKESEVTTSTVKGEDVYTKNVIYMTRLQDIGSLIGGKNLYTVRHNDGHDYVLWSNSDGSAMLHNRDACIKCSKSMKDSSAVTF